MQQCARRAIFRLAACGRECAKVVWPLHCAFSGMRPVWQTVDGFEKFKRLLSSTRFELIDPTFENWLSANVVHRSQIPLRCKTCRMKCYPMLQNFIKKPGGNCLCTRVRWKSIEWFKQFKEFLSETRFELRDDTFASWLKTKVCSTSTVELRCTVCGTETDAWVKSFMSTRSAACLCTHVNTVSCRAYFDRFVAFVSTSNYELVGVSNLSEWQKVATSKNSKIKLRCKTCQGLSTPSISNFNRLQTGSCLCNRNMTEKRVIALVKSSITKLDVEVTLEFSYPDLLGVNGGLLRADITLLQNEAPILSIEVDGPHHFEDFVVYGDGGKANNTLQHDLIKEKYLTAHGIPIARLSSCTAKYNRLCWREWLRTIVNRAEFGLLNPGVYRIGHEYNSGEYHKCRIAESPIVKQTLSPFA